MKAQIVYNWIKDTDFSIANPLSCEIVDVVLGGKNNSEKILQFKVGELLRQLSVYGENWNILVMKLGNETDDWQGKRFRLTQFVNASDGKKIKRIEV